MGVLVKDSLQPTAGTIFEDALPIRLLLAQHYCYIRLIEERPKSFGDLSGLIAYRFVSYPLQSPSHSCQRAQRGDCGTTDRIQSKNLRKIGGRAAQIGRAARYLARGSDVRTPCVLGLRVKVIDKFVV